LVVFVKRPNGPPKQGTGDGELKGTVAARIDMLCSYRFNRSSCACAAFGAASGGIKLRFDQLQLGEMDASDGHVGGFASEVVVKVTQRQRLLRFDALIEAFIAEV
jgi:hypothetical protein